MERYNAIDAQRRYLERRMGACKAAKLSDEMLRAELEAMLMEDFSPGQIAQTLPLKLPDNPAMWVSHEMVYQHIYADKRHGGKLYAHLLFPPLHFQRKGDERKHKRHHPTVPAQGN